MRKLKFRAWDKYRMNYFPKVWGEYEEDGDGNNSSKKMSINGIFEQKSGLSLCGDYEFMQYTGFKDKNGKEIYEGDIVKHGNGIQKVYKVYYDVEVIGNIYENPELLKVKNDQIRKEEKCYCHDGMMCHYCCEKELNAS